MIKKFFYCDSSVEKSESGDDDDDDDDKDDKDDDELFCGMVDQRKAFSIIFSWNLSQRSSPS